MHVVLELTLALVAVADNMLKLLQVVLAVTVEELELELVEEEGCTKLSVTGTEKVNKAVDDIGERSYLKWIIRRGGWYLWIKRCILIMRMVVVVDRTPATHDECSLCEKKSVLAPLNLR